MPGDNVVRSQAVLQRFQRKTSIRSKAKLCHIRHVRAQVQAHVVSVREVNNLSALYELGVCTAQQ